MHTGLYLHCVTSVAGSFGWTAEVDVGLGLVLYHLLWFSGSNRWPASHYEDRCSQEKFHYCRQSVYLLRSSQIRDFGNFKEWNIHQMGVHNIKLWILLPHFPSNSSTPVIGSKDKALSLCEVELGTDGRRGNAVRTDGEHLQSMVSMELPTRSLLFNEEPWSEPANMGDGSGSSQRWVNSYGWYGPNWSAWGDRAVWIASGEPRKWNYPCSWKETKTRAIALKSPRCITNRQTLGHKISPLCWGSRD